LSTLLQSTMARTLKPLADSVARTEKNVENLDEGMIELRGTVGTPGRFRRLEKRVAELEAKLGIAGEEG